MESGDKSPHRKTPPPPPEDELQRRLEEAEQTLSAIRQGEVDAIVVAGPLGDQVYSLTGAEHTYRVIVETMHEAALTTDLDGTILFCNQRFCDLMRTPMHEALGRKVTTFAAPAQQPVLQTVMKEAQAGPVRRHLVLRAADGTVVPVLLAASLLQAPESVSVCWVASDLTELEASANSLRVLREQQQALEESEARFRAIFESSLDAVVLVDDDQVYVQANPGAEAIFGLPPEHLIGRRIADFLDIDIDAAALWRAFLRTGRFRSELKIIDAHDEVRDVDCYGVAGILPSRHLFVIRDVTVRKRAEEALQEANERLGVQTEELQAQTEELRVANEHLQVSEQVLQESEAVARQQAARLETVLDAAPAVIWIAHDRDSRVITGNRAAREFSRTAEGTDNLSKTGPEAEKLAHYRIFENGVELSPEEMPVHVVARSGRELRDHAIEFRFDDGTRRWLTGNVVPLFDSEGRPNGAIAAYLDVTKRKQAEEALRELNATLESKVALRTRELEYRATQLQKLALELSQAEERERRRLAEILHDDLQQQLAAAKFHVGILGGRARGDASVQQATTQIDKMLGDAIETSRSLSHELSPAVMYHGDLGEVLAWLANQIRTKHGLIVRVDTQGQIDAQSDGLKTFLYKAVQELLFNAVKHARVHEATVRLRRRGPYLCLAVSDKGRGFDPQDLRQTAGFGLLSIRERIALLGGRMKIESAKGQGSRFILTVPDGTTDGKVRGSEGKKTRRAEEKDARPSDSLHASAASSVPRQRVLVADDHEIVRGGLVSLFADAPDLKVVGEAGNGREAVDLAYRLKPDVVIMDVAMPLISGEEATKQILRHLPQTRIVALSMYEEAGLVERMYQAGAESYVLKTAPYEELLAAVRGTK